MMKKSVLVFLLGSLLAGCVKESDVAVTDAQLRNQRFVLQSVDGQPLPASQTPPELQFGEKMQVTAKMCNRFMGDASLDNGKLKVSKMAATRMLCADPQLNALDSTLNDMLNTGAQVDLTASQLTLATATRSLVYQRATQ